MVPTGVPVCPGEGRVKIHSENPYKVISGEVLCLLSNTTQVKDGSNQQRRKKDADIPSIL